VFVLLVMAGLVLFFREEPDSESYGGRLSVVESPMLKSPHGRTTRCDVSRGAAQHAGIGTAR
jgi:hypothetical protein